MFENITKNVIIKDSTVFNADCNESKGYIKTVAQCYCGFDMARTAKEAIENAEFIAFAFNLQQRFDISKLEEAVEMLGKVFKMCDMLRFPTEGELKHTKIKIHELLTQIKK